MIPASHKDSIVKYLVETGEQRFASICEGIYRVNISVHVTPYLMQRLCDEGRIEKVGHDSYRAKAGKAGTP